MMHIHFWFPPFWQQQNNPVAKLTNALASVAQGIEHWFPVPKVEGSNPFGGTPIYGSVELASLIAKLILQPKDGPASNARRPN